MTSFLTADAFGIRRDASDSICRRPARVAPARGWSAWCLCAATNTSRTRPMFDLRARPVHFMVQYSHVPGRSW